MAEKKKYRRSNGEGSVFKHQSGRWCGQIALGVNEEGKRVRKTVFGDTRAEVVEKLKELLGAINAKKLKPSINTKLGHFMDKWLKDLKRPTVSPRTYEWYLNIAKTIPDGLKDEYLPKVNSYQVQNMLNTLENDGASVRSVKATYDLLNQVYKAAVGFLMVGENPLDKVKITRKDTAKKQKALSADERKHILQAIESSGTYKPIIYTMIGMGLRIGETIALSGATLTLNAKPSALTKPQNPHPKLITMAKSWVGAWKSAGRKLLVRYGLCPCPRS